MTLTRETVNDLVDRLRRVWADDLGNGLVDEAATALLAAWDERDRVAAINVDHCRAVNTLLIDGSRWQDRAEAAEAEIVELTLNATARDVRIFELKEELDNAEGKLAERDAENARLRGRLAETEAALSDIARRVGPYWTASGCAEDRAALNKEPKP